MNIHKLFLTKPRGDWQDGRLIDIAEHFEEITLHARCLYTFIHNLILVRIFHYEAQPKLKVKRKFHFPSCDRPHVEFISTCTFNFK